MYARVARWEGASAEALDQVAAGIREDAESGPPEGLPAKKLLLLQDREGGRSMAITLFETEDDYRRGDETLNSMSRPATAWASASASTNTRSRSNSTTD